MPEAISNSQSTIGLAAGWGRYPVVVAEALKRELKDLKGVSAKVVHRDLVKTR